MPLLVEGYHEGGRKRAREQLHEFWYEVSSEISRIVPGAVHRQVRSSSFRRSPGLEWTAAFNPRIC